MSGKIFNNKKLGSILGRKRKKKADSSVSGFISNKYVIKKEALKLISDLIEEACTEKVKNPYRMQTQLRLIERVLLTELEEYVDAKDNIAETAELIRKQIAEENQRVDGQVWTTNITTLGVPGSTMPQPLPGGYIGVSTDLVPFSSDPIQDGGSSHPDPYSISFGTIT